MSVFNRVGVRTVGGDPPFGPPGFAPEVPARMFPGADAMSFVALFRLHRIAFDGSVLQVFIDNDDPIGNAGYIFELFDYGATSVASFGAGDGVSFAFADSRSFAPADEGKVHLAVGVATSNGEVTTYLNGIPGASAALGTYAPATPPATYGVIGTQSASGLEDADLFDLAVVDRAFTAEQVAALWRQTRAAGRVPTSFAPWHTLMRAERLVGHSQVWDFGGQNAGRAMLNAHDAGPVLTSVEIVPSTWGGFGT